MTDVLLKLAGATTQVELAKLGLRAGFELETQATEGYTCQEFDEDRYQEAIDEWVDDNSPCTDYLSNRTRERILDDLRNAAEEYVDRDDFGGDTDSVIREIERVVPDGVEVGEDGSVTGFEFRTGQGGVGIAEFRKLAKALFELNHRINVECGFHIHVSVPGVEDSALRCLFNNHCTEFLVNEFHNFPKEVQRRWDLGLMRQWAPFQSVSAPLSKSAAVAVRESTLEFRLWGNVTTYESAKICLDLTLRSLQYAAVQILSGALAVKFSERDRDCPVLQKKLKDRDPTPIHVLLRNATSAAQAVKEADLHTDEFAKANVVNQ